uniref:Uncharacterized protein n=1 Tax=Siphoviridae sp. ctRiO19 TaxID=2826337 RepID=A0A8S5LX61_9CAUD|nr:MAG TPA: hypothetical protein [Siphoviridae sp. ctRiO19]DAX35449.1 MAG TPA: hypothetical protein [Caudoviricetes sp.]
MYIIIKILKSIKNRKRHCVSRIINDAFRISDYNLVVEL